MKTFLIFALLVTLGSILLTGCASSKDTTVPQDRNVTSTSRTYSK